MNLSNFLMLGCLVFSIIAGRRALISRIGIPKLLVLPFHSLLVLLDLKKAVIDLFLNSYLMSVSWLDFYSISMRHGL